MSLGGNELSLFSFAILPLRKREEEGSNIYTADSENTMGGNQPMAWHSEKRRKCLLSGEASVQSRARDYALSLANRKKGRSEGI